MKLSLAIRLGAMLRPQAFGRSFSAGGSCALGAAEEAMGIDTFGLCFETSPWYPLFMLFVTHGIRCPECGIKQTKYGSPGFLIPHLNDDHRWSREAIADWVQEREEQFDLEPAPALPAALEREVEDV